jgi:hypothetical protein
MELSNVPVWHIVMATAIFVIAFLITTMVHELAHGVVSCIAGNQPVLHHVFVKHNKMTERKRAVVASAGPLVSLCQGVVFVAIFYWVSVAAGGLQLFILWLGMHGLINMFGYLMTTPFVPNADLGIISRCLKWPGWFNWLLALLGLALVTAVGFWMRDLLFQALPIEASVLSATAQSKVVLLYAIVPWLLGSVAIIFLTMPAPHWISYAYPVLSGFFLIVTYSSAGSLEVFHGGVSVWAGVHLGGWIFLLLVVVIIFRSLVKGRQLCHTNT